MANVVDIILRAKDSTGVAFRAASKRIATFGKQNLRSLQNVGRAFKKIGTAAAAGFAAVGAAMAAAAKRAEQFNKQIGQITTLADISFGALKREVRSLSSEFGLAKDELTKGLYDALSAGVPKENVFDFIRVAAKGAVAGAATTAESVDILTTALNAFQIPASKAEEVSDQLFTTVRLGKTTLAELSESFAKVGPIASASGVKINEVLAAVASLTKQGTPTSVAMTQIRAAIISMNKTLGDGWTKTMTLQEGMIAMRNAAGGSTAKLKEMTGRVEGTLGILGLTGEKAAGAAEDLKELGAAAGATDEAFGKMENLNAVQKVIQTMDNGVTLFGDVVLAAFGKQLDSSREGLQEWLDTFDAEKIDRTGMQLAIFAHSAVTTADNIGDTFATVFAGLGDTLTSPFVYAAEVIGAFLNGVAEQLYHLIDIAVEVGKKARHPFTHDFQMPSGQMAAGASKEFYDALGGRAFRRAAQRDVDLVGRIEERQAKEEAAIKEITDLYHKRQVQHQEDRAKMEREQAGSIADAKAKHAKDNADENAETERGLNDENLAIKKDTETGNREDLAAHERELDAANIEAKKQDELEAIEEVAQARAAIESDYASGGAGGVDPTNRNYNLTAIQMAGDMAKVQAEATADAMRDVMTEVNAPLLEELRGINTNTRETAETIKDAITLSD